MAVLMRLVSLLLIVIALMLLGADAVTSLEKGGEVTVHYDPMIAKVIATGETREQARRRLLTALRQFPILGVRTNIPFLINILEHPRFAAGSIDTGFLDREGESVRPAPGVAIPPDVQAVAEAIRYSAPAHGTGQPAAPDPLDPSRRGLDAGRSRCDQGRVRRILDAAGTHQRRVSLGPGVSTALRTRLHSG